MPPCSHGREWRLGGNTDHWAWESQEHSRKSQLSCKQLFPWLSLKSELLVMTRSGPAGLLSSRMRTPLKGLFLQTGPRANLVMVYSRQGGGDMSRVSPQPLVLEHCSEWLTHWLCNELNKQQIDRLSSSKGPLNLSKPQFPHLQSRNYNVCLACCFSSMSKIRDNVNITVIIQQIN